MIVKISYDKLPDLLRQLSDKLAVYLPVDKENGTSVYEKYEEERPFPQN